ncbi:MAG TPA: hypothetical protein VNE41_06835, partial [Chitinophagaceae bacterium]|nr:hypothetical protein [Chitinophagaceae bacterium]
MAVKKRITSCSFYDGFFSIFFYACVWRSYVFSVFYRKAYLNDFLKKLIRLWVITESLDIPVNLMAEPRVIH